MSSLAHALETEIRPHLGRLDTEQERLRTDHRAHDRRLTAVESAAASVVQAVDDAKDKIGASLGILIKKVDHLTLQVEGKKA